MNKYQGLVVTNSILINSTTATKKDTQNQDGLGKQEEDEELADITLKFKDEQQTKLPKISNTKNNQDYDILLTTEYLPPLDVLNYYEDGLRLYPILKHLRFPLELATSEYELTSSKESLEKLGPTDTDIGEEEIKEMMHKSNKYPTPPTLLLLLTTLSTTPTRRSQDYFYLRAGTLRRIECERAVDELDKYAFQSYRIHQFTWLSYFICPNCDDTIGLHLRERSQDQADQRSYQLFSRYFTTLDELNDTKNAIKFTHLFLQEKEDQLRVLTDRPDSMKESILDHLVLLNQIRKILIGHFEE
ncbi:hypothetical protein H4Q26_015389 [Puccinia striiformis f. sp. tritici PST-130]|nr:hypothetical protein H4Q26_015389 [Puccinia striiformis f. sp. tritici PST-130]